MIKNIIRINFFITSLFFFIKVLFHIMLFFQEYQWIKQTIAITQKFPLLILLHPLNLPIFGLLLGMISLALFSIQYNKDKEINVKVIYILMPFVYASIWALILFFGWKA